MPRKKRDPRGLKKGQKINREVKFPIQYQIRLSVGQKFKLIELGGAAWIRKKIDESEVY